jgi:hypothetical protein
VLGAALPKGIIDAGFGGASVFRHAAQLVLLGAQRRN